MNTARGDGDTTVKNEASKTNTEGNGRDERPFEKRKERKRQKSVGDQKYRKIKPNKKTYHANSYKMSSVPRGSALLINNETFLRPEFYPDRPGSRLDINNLQELFGQLGFTVETHWNLSRAQTIGTSVGQTYNHTVRGKKW